MENNILLNKVDVHKINYLYYDNYIKKTIVIMNNNDAYYFKYSCKKLLEILCMKNGSTLKGRMEFCAYNLNIRKKIPIIISERNEIIFFPLYGYRNKEAMWIAFNEVKKVCNEENLTTQIIFKNNISIHVNMNYRSINNQMRRCKRIIKLLNDL